MYQMLPFQVQISIYLFKITLISQGLGDTKGGCIRNYISLQSQIQSIINIMLKIKINHSSNKVIHYFPKSKDLTKS